MSESNDTADRSSGPDPFSLSSLSAATMADVKADLSPSTAALAGVSVPPLSSEVSLPPTSVGGIVESSGLAASVINGTHRPGGAVADAVQAVGPETIGSVATRTNALSAVPLAAKQSPLAAAGFEPALSSTVIGRANKSETVASALETHGLTKSVSSGILTVPQPDTEFATALLGPVARDAFAATNVSAHGLGGLAGVEHFGLTQSLIDEVFATGAASWMRPLAVLTGPNALASIPVLYETGGLADAVLPSSTVDVLAHSIFPPNVADSLFATEPLVATEPAAVAGLLSQLNTTPATPPGRGVPGSFAERIERGFYEWVAVDVIGAADSVSYKIDFYADQVILANRMVDKREAFLNLWNEIRETEQTIRAVIKEIAPYYLFFQILRELGLL